MNKIWVLTTGVFHLLHPGHLELLEYCSSLGSVVVGINTDEYVLNKSGRILIPLKDRIYMLQSIKFVDKVFPFSESNPSQLIQRLRPHIFVKGPDYIDIETPEQKVCKELGVRYQIAPGVKRFNTSDLLKN